MQSKSLVHQNGMNQHLSEQHVSDSACERFRYVMNQIDWEHSKKLLVKRCKQFVNEKSAGDKRWFWDAALGKVSHGGLVSNRKQRLVLCQCQLPNHRTLFVVRFLEQSHISKRKEEKQTNIEHHKIPSVYIGFGVKLQAIVVHKTNVYSRSGFHLFCYSCSCGGRCCCCCCFCLLCVVGVWSRVHKIIRN